MIQFDFTGTDNHIETDVLEGLRLRAAGAQRALIEGRGAGNEWLGWRSILDQPDEGLMADLEATAREIRKDADVLLCIGIGGSYLGADAVIRAFTPPFTRADGPEILFAGHHLSGSYLKDLLEYVDGKSVFVNVISKSGTTVEPALAFRVVRTWMEGAFDDNARRIVVTTDASGGALRELAQTRGYRSFVIPGDVGGRFSVLTPVGLLPIAAAGCNIQDLFGGAVEMKRLLDDSPENSATEYALRRYALHEIDFNIEQLCLFDPALSGLGDWWRQLFGESEGKQGKGLYPAVCTFTTDLHSMGQMIQEGHRNVLETFLFIDTARDDLPIPDSDTDTDGLSYLAGRSVSDVNRAAFEGTVAAHSEGGVPTIRVVLPELTERIVGALLYFFEHAVSIGGYLLGVNPFDQPGVEAYKKQMLGRLAKPGHDHTDGA